MPHNNSYTNANPYTRATGAYGSTASATDPRALEGTILLKAAAQLEELARRLRAGENLSREEIGLPLTYNQKLWQLFIEDMRNPDHALPQEIKNNIATLAVFVFKRTQEVLIDTVPGKLKVLIDIDRNIASGLLKSVPLSERPEPQKAAAGSGSATDDLI